MFYRKQPLGAPDFTFACLCNRLLCILRTLRQIKRALNKGLLHTSQLTPGVLKETNKRQLWLLVEAITVFGKAITARRPPNTPAISAHVTLLWPTFIPLSNKDKRAFPLLKDMIMLINKKNDGLLKWATSLLYFLSDWMINQELDILLWLKILASKWHNRV